MIYELVAMYVLGAAITGYYFDLLQRSYNVELNAKRTGMCVVLWPVFVATMILIGAVEMIRER